MPAQAAVAPKSPRPGSPAGPTGTGSPPTKSNTLLFVQKDRDSAARALLDPEMGGMQAIRDRAADALSAWDHGEPFGVVSHGR
jgi:hypothetical protein